jgi:hypothetical protein
MQDTQRITADEARAVGVRLGLDWAKVSLEQFRRGLEVELEHGARDPETDVTRDDLALTGKIAWAHLKEIRDYYTRLDRLEAEAHAEIAGPWPLLGGKPDPEPAAGCSADDLGGVIMAFSEAHSGLLSKLRHGSGILEQENRRGRPPTRDSSNADLFSLMNEG